MIDIRKLQIRLDSIENLPTLPTVATKLMELLSGPHSVKAVADIMKSDAAITTRILKIANSAYYSTFKSITTVKMALVILGEEEISNIVYGLSLMKTFGQNSDINQQKLFEHSIVTALIATKISQTFKHQTKGVEFTVAIIHDIGINILNQYFHKEFEEIIKIMEEDELKTENAVMQVIGITHFQIGAWLATKWKLPKSLIEGILYCNAPQLSPNCKLLPSIIQIADLISNLIGFNQMNHCTKDDYLNAEGWEYITNNLEFDKDGFFNEILDSKNKYEDLIKIVS